jgi:thiamine biosynthesis lipoprotein
VIDPNTGERPATLSSLTVIGQRLARTDAYATAAFAMGDGAAQWLSDRGLYALLVYPDGRTRQVGRPPASGAAAGA